jgi:hypothetical protein
MMISDENNRYFSETLEHIQRQADDLAYRNIHRRAHVNSGSIARSVKNRINTFLDHTMPAEAGRVTLAELPNSMY